MVVESAEFVSSAKTRDACKNCALMPYEPGDMSAELTYPRGLYIAAASVTIKLISILDFRIDFERGDGSGN